MASHQVSIGILSLYWKDDHQHNKYLVVQLLKCDFKDVKQPNEII
jgi:hypothetical protein